MSGPAYEMDQKLGAYRISDPNKVWIELEVGKET